VTVGVSAGLISVSPLGATRLNPRHTFALYDKTTALVRELGRDVDVIVFMDPGVDYANYLYGDVHELTERARRSLHLHVEYLDIDREP